MRFVYKSLPLALVIGNEKGSAEFTVYVVYMDADGNSTAAARQSPRSSPCP